ncbi:hypothetical protein [uncultured Pontibacter sp.]|uniref:hypothetical protein n=1 Tax=uncultured Pontibacter sp. TaxID=453356 RepID=UPI00261BDDDE|nr:hypothetical protein [uncultured Pontibacter sp.]
MQPLFCFNLVFILQPPPNRKYTYVRGAPKMTMNMKSIPSFILLTILCLASCQSRDNTN